jgi:ABC-type Fe3+ transport system permease subunit
MVAFSMDALGNTLIFMLIGCIITLIYSLFMAYLNWKQSKVNNQMKELIEVSKDIKRLLEKMVK